MRARALPFRAFRSWILLSWIFAGGCATSSQDLVRARGHYTEAHFPEALALLRLLGDETDALTLDERVEYAFLRGMTDLRLAELSRVPSDAAEFRSFARQHLEEALKLSRARPDALNAESKAALERAIADMGPTGAAPP